MRAQTPSPNSVPLGTTTAARPGGRLRRIALQLAHDELEEEQRRLGRLPVVGEVALDARLLLAAERRVGEDHVHPVVLADLGQLEAQALPGSICGASRPCSSRFIWHSRYGSGFGSPPKSAPPAAACGAATVLHCSLQVLERLDQEAAGAAGRVEHGFAEPRVGDLRP